MTFTISGTITFSGSPLSGVQLTGFPGNPVVTNTSGSYTATVNYGWSGTVTPTKAGYSFAPDKWIYSHVKKNSTQNYLAVRSYLISGVVIIDGLGLPGVVMSGFPQP